MALPDLAPFPTAELRGQIPPSDWEAALKAWTSLIHSYLELSEPAFQREVANSTSVVDFIISFTTEVARGHTTPSDSSYMDQLRRGNFMLISRILSGKGILLKKLVEPSFIADLCIVYSKSRQLPGFVDGLWTRAKLQADQEMVLSKERLIKVLEASNTHPPEQLDHLLLQAVAFLKSCRQYGVFLMTGSDFLDALILTWTLVPSHSRRKLTAVLYYASIALLSKPKPNVSLFLDHMYSLKANNDHENKTKGQPSMLESLVSTTPFLERASQEIPELELGRAGKLFSYLETLQSSTGANGRRKKGNRRDKGKGVAPIGSYHLYSMDLINQIKDLFPSLGHGFILKLLEGYDNNVEQIIAHLLEDSLSQHLKDMDHSLSLTPNLNTQSLSEPLTTFSGHPERRNIHSNDQMANLTISPSAIHIGKRDTSMVPTSPNKAAILAALATFDSDSDERDDTYDADDIGGTVDNSEPPLDGPSGSGTTNSQSEELLIKAWRSTPEIFQRDATTRRGKAREELRKATGLSDEAIEGWGIMLARDPRRLRRLEASVSTFTGNQRELTPTAWRAGEEDEEGSDQQRNRAGGSRGRRGGHRGTMGGGRGRGGGDVAGSASDTTTRNARQRKDAHKGSRANHNRRDQRARKVARAGFLG